MKNSKKESQEQAQRDAYSGVLESINQAVKTCKGKIKKIKEQGDDAPLAFVAMYKSCLTAGFDTKRKSVFVNASLFPQAFTKEHASRLAKSAKNGLGELPSVVSHLEYYEARLESIHEATTKLKLKYKDKLPELN